MTDKQNISNFDVSVVVPTYNRYNRVRLVLRSLLEQNFNGTYEIIVVDDGSTDGTANDLESIDERIKVIRQKNMGAAVARNTGIQHANSDIIIFNDSDDIAYPNKIDVLFRGLQRHPECVASIAIIENKTKVDWQLPYWAKGISGEEIVIDKPLEHFFKHYFPLASGMNIAVRKRVAESASADNSFYKAANDTHFQFKVAAQGKIVCIAKVTGEYFVGDGLTSQLGTYTQNTYGLISLVENFNNLGKPATHSEALRRRIENETGFVLLPLLFNLKFKLLSRVCINFLKYGRLRKIPRRLWWGISSYLQKQN